MSTVNLAKIRERELEKYYKVVANDSRKARQIIKTLDYKNDPYLLRCIAVTHRDEAIMSLDGKLKKRFNKRQLALAKKAIDRAFDLSPHCRDVLYVKGSIYNALGDKFLAIDCYIEILELKYRKGLNVNCSGADLPYIKMIHNDSYFQLYRLFYEVGLYDTALDLLNTYRKGLKKGIQTIYKPLEDYLMD